jgi:hypothetical protein
VIFVRADRPAGQAGGRGRHPDRGALPPGLGDRMEQGGARRARSRLHHPGRARRGADRSAENHERLIHAEDADYFATTVLGWRCPACHHAQSSKRPPGGSRQSSRHRAATSVTSRSRSGDGIRTRWGVGIPVDARCGPTPTAGALIWQGHRWGRAGRCGQTTPSRRRRRTVRGRVGTLRWSRGSGWHAQPWPPACGRAGRSHQRLW